MKTRDFHSYPKRISLLAVFVPDWFTFFFHRYSQTQQMFQSLEVQTSSSGSPIILMGQAVLNQGFATTPPSQPSSLPPMQLQHQQHQQQRYLQVGQDKEDGV